MANEQNLIPAKKGEVRNPNGKPKGVQNSKTRLLRLLELVTKVRNPVTGEEEEFSIAEQLDMQIIAKARKGDLKAYEIILDRLEGKPKQSTELEVSGGLNIVWEEKKTYVGKTGSL
jgi:Family of unknown function (DUF5681)